MTLFLTKTSKRPFVAIVSGIQPGCLISRAFLLACWANSSSNFLASSSYFFLRSSIRAFLASICFFRSLISTLSPATIFLVSFLWLSNSKLKFVYIQKKKYLHPLPLFFDDPIVLIFLVDASVLGFVELFLQSFLNGLQLSNRLLQNIDIFFLSIQIAL